jgi:hypothetical protein
MKVYSGFVDICCSTYMYSSESFFPARNRVKCDFMTKLTHESRATCGILKNLNYEFGITALTAKIRQQTFH